MIARALTIGGSDPSGGGGLESAMVATGFAYDAGVRERQAQVVARLAGRVRDIRRMGAAALDLAWVACGRVDGFWECRLQPWDVAAGSLVVRRAGGRVSDFTGNEPGVDAMEVRLPTRMAMNTMPIIPSATKIPTHKSMVERSIPKLPRRET